MRSLAAKLTLSFLLIGVAGALLVAIITSQRTRQEFDQFVTTQSHQQIADTLGRYYQDNGGWVGVADFIYEDAYLHNHASYIIVVDNTGHLAYGLGPARDGEPYPYDNLDEGVPIPVGEEVVGTLLVGTGEKTGYERNRIPPEVIFLQNVNTAAIAGSVIAGTIALVLGVVLARSLTQPIRALTRATQTVAEGDLGQQVEVRSRDEIGELALSFNQMSADLAQASQFRKQMTADIAHDLRTPLTVLRGYTEGLKDGSVAGDHRLYEIMHEEVVLLQHLVEDLRTLSLADAGELKLKRRAVDPKALLERTGIAYYRQAEQKGLALRIEAEPDLPSVSVDLERMTQVLNNLVSNALRFTSTGEIVLAAAVERGKMLLQVRDTGSGIAPEALPHIFDRFFRADEARQRTEEGASGLGLAIAKAIVESHQGTISANSNPGRGTTFSISLPLV